MNWIHASVLSAALALASQQPAFANETIVFGLSHALSGPAAYFGKNTTWVAERAAEKINEDGGIKVGDKTYQLQVKAYDNLYNAAGGTTAAQTMISREGIKFIANSQSTAAVIATQALAERVGVLLFTGVWGKSVKGPNHPMTFTNLNSPPEILPPLFEYVQKHHPQTKTVAILNPNDASGQEVAEESVRQWERLGYTVVYNDYFERSTTDFSPIATRILATKPDIVDAGASPLPNVGHVFREMQTQGWDGVKIASSGSEAEALVNSGGAAVEGTYLGLAAVFDGENATDTQRDLNARALAELGQPLNQATIAAWDSVFALKVAMEQANSIDPKVVAETLPTITFESSYGPSGFGYADTYGLPNQMLLPVIITQVRDGKMIELDRIVPEELKGKM